MKDAAKRVVEAFVVAAAVKAADEKPSAKLMGLADGT